MRFNTELVALEQNAREVRARVRSRASGLEEVIRADWLVAADGASGTVRETLGIGRHGAGDLQHWMNVIFEADLPTELDGRRLTAAFVTEVNGSFVPREGGRWLMALPYRPGRGERTNSLLKSTSY